MRRLLIACVVAAALAMPAAPLSAQAAKNQDTGRRDGATPAAQSAQGAQRSTHAFTAGASIDLEIGDVTHGAPYTSSTGGGADGSFWFNGSWMPRASPIAVQIEGGTELPRTTTIARNVGSGAFSRHYDQQDSWIVGSVGIPIVRDRTIQLEIVLGGGAIARRPDDVITPVRGLSGTPPSPYRVQQTDVVPLFTTGIDLSAPVSKRLDITIRFRVNDFSRGIDDDLSNLRLSPGIGLRWRF